MAPAKRTEYANFMSGKLGDRSGPEISKWLDTKDGNGVTGREKVSKKSGIYVVQSNLPQDDEIPSKNEPTEKGAQTYKIGKATVAAVPKLSGNIDILTETGGLADRLGSYYSMFGDMGSIVANRYPRPENKRKIDKDLSGGVRLKYVIGSNGPPRDQHGVRKTQGSDWPVDVEKELKKNLKAVGGQPQRGPNSEFIRIRPDKLKRVVESTTRNTSIGNQNDVEVRRSKRIKKGGEGATLPTTIQESLKQDMADTSFASTPAKKLPTHTYKLRTRNRKV
jgi:hypothetical protein